MVPIKAVSTIMQNTVEWINLLPGGKAASTKLAVKRHTFILRLPRAKSYEADVRQG